MSFETLVNKQTYNNQADIKNFFSEESAIKTVKRKIPTQLMNKEKERKKAKRLLDRGKRSFFAVDHCVKEEKKSEQ